MSASGSAPLPAMPNVEWTYAECRAISHSRLKLLVAVLNTFTPDQETTTNTVMPTFSPNPDFDEPFLAYNARPIPFTDTIGKQVEQIRRTVVAWYNAELAGPMPNGQPFVEGAGAQIVKMLVELSYIAMSSADLEWERLTWKSGTNTLNGMKHEIDSVLEEVSKRIAHTIADIEFKRTDDYWYMNFCDSYAADYNRTEPDVTEIANFKLPTKNEICAPPLEAMVSVLEQRKQELDACLMKVDRAVRINELYRPKDIVRVIHYSPAEPMKSKSFRSWIHADGKASFDDNELAVHVAGLAKRLLTFWVEGKFSSAEGVYP